MANQSDERTQCIVHPTLMRAGRIAATLQHDGPSVEPERGCDCSIFDMVGVYTGLGEQVGHVKLPPDLAACTVRQDFRDAQKGMDVRDGVLIENPVVVNPSRKSSGVSFRD